MDDSSIIRFINHKSISGWMFTLLMVKLKKISRRQEEHLTYEEALPTQLCMNKLQKSHSFNRENICIPNDYWIVMGIQLIILNKQLTHR